MATTKIELLNPEESNEIADVDLTDKKQMKAVRERLTLLDNLLQVRPNKTFIAPRE